MSVFVKDALERAIKTFVQVLLTFFIGDVTVLSVDWGTAAALAGTAALVSIGTSVMSYKSIRSNTTASLVPEVVAEPVASAPAKSTGGYPGA